MYTRREFLVTSASASLGVAAITASPAGAQTVSQAPYFGYVSVRRDNRVSIFSMDPVTGRVTWLQPVPVEGGPDPLAFHPRHRFLYVACRDRKQLGSYRIDAATGALSHVNTVPIDGEPIQIVADRTGRFVLAVYFYQSLIAVYAVGADGAIDPKPIELRYTAYGCHGIEIDPSNRYVFVPHVARSGGPNAVAQFKFDEKTGRLTPNIPTFLPLFDNEGPRHLLVHPTLNYAYSADEQGASATAYRLDPSSGLLTKLHSVPTVPSDFKKVLVSCSEVLVHPNGRLLFVVTRDHDSIASFTIDQATGRLTPADRVPTEPDVRPLCIDPAGRFMAAAGSGGKAGRMATYEIDAVTGKMTPRDTYEAGNGPMWILMMRGA